MVLFDKKDLKGIFIYLFALLVSEFRINFQEGVL